MLLMIDYVSNQYHLQNINVPKMITVACCRICIFLYNVLNRLNNKVIICYCASGFFGWSQAEGEAALAALRVEGPGAGAAVTTTRLDPDSEDDGFFEQSSNGDSDDTHLNHSINNSTMVILY